MADNEKELAEKVAKAEKDGIEKGMKGKSASTFGDSPQEAAARKRGEALGKLVHNSETKE